MQINESKPKSRFAKSGMHTEMKDNLNLRALELNPNVEIWATVYIGFLKPTMITGLWNGNSRWIEPVWYDILTPLYSHPGVNFHPGVKISLRYLHPPYDIFTPSQ